MSDGGKLAQSLESLCATAAQLNKSSESMNAIFRSVEKALNEANIGLEVWVSDEEMAVGYARYLHEWRLVIDRAGGVEEGTDEAHGGQGADQYCPLHQATRKERIAAFQQLPRLLVALNEAAQHMLGTIQEAKSVIAWE